MSVQSMLNELKKIEKKICKGVREGLVSEGEEILYRSQHEFVPIDEGDLFNSAKMAVIEDGTVEGLQVVLSYGDEKTGMYALTVHETPSGHDPPTWKGKEVKFDTGGPQYLSKPLFEAENGMIERIASHIKLS